MRKDSSEERRAELEVGEAEILQQGVSGAVLRTRALFAAESLLNELAVCNVSRWRNEARLILENYPTRCHLMRLAEEHALLDAAEAQRLGCRKERLDV